MNNDNKRIIIYLPNHPNISGIMTLEYAKSLAEEKCPNKSENVLIIVINDNDVTFCLERNSGNWIEKDISGVIF